MGAQASAAKNTSISRIKKSSVLCQEYSSAGNFSIEDKKIHPGRPEHVSVSMAYRAKQIKLCLIFLIEGINIKLRNKKE